MVYSIRQIHTYLPQNPKGFLVFQAAWKWQCLPQTFFFCTLLNIFLQTPIIKGKKATRTERKRRIPMVTLSCSSFLVQTSHYQHGNWHLSSKALN